MYQIEYQQSFDKAKKMFKYPMNKKKNEYEINVQQDKVQTKIIYSELK